MARGRAVWVAGGAVAGSAALGVLLVHGGPQPPWLTVGAAAAGLALVAAAAVSVLRRDPVFCTPADRVTLLRGVLIGGVTTIAGVSLFDTAPTRSWWLIALAVPALALDGLDGWVARRTGTATPEGARLDMETDAAFFLVLSIAAAGVVGSWVLAIGAMRYLFLAASWVRPALKGPLPFRQFRWFTAGFQGVALIVALVPITPRPLAVTITGTALALLIVSFGADVLRLERAHGN